MRLSLSDCFRVRRAGQRRSQPLRAHRNIDAKARFGYSRIMTAHPTYRYPNLTQAAEGLPRHGFTIEDVERMVEVGIIPREERFELIGGEIVPMSPKGIRHERWKMALNTHFVLFINHHPDLKTQIEFIPETTLRLAPDTFLEPDFIFVSKAVGLEGLVGPTALLAIEIADTSLAYDLGRKSEIYAAFGVRELWVLDVNQRKVSVFRDPTPLKYRQRLDHDAREMLSAAWIPGLSLRIDEIEV
jgi:Uma2 family endonuclease